MLNVMPGGAILLKRLGVLVLAAFALATALVFAGRELGCLNQASRQAASRPDRIASRARQVTVFYLHGNIQCAGCKGMSAAARQMVEADFAEELKTGQLRFRMENFDRPGNEFFRQRCQVVSPTVLLVEYQDGQAARWENLSAIWDRSDSEEKLRQYLRDETRAFYLHDDPRPARPAAVVPPVGSDSWIAIWLAAASAFGLGLLAAISPCALATNAVALAFLGQGGLPSRQVVMRGAGYSAGRMVAYMAVGAVIVSGLLSVSVGGRFAIKYANGLLGPVLILISLFLFKWVRLDWNLVGIAGTLERRAEKGGLWSALLLGIVLALAFCPMSAALFFGGLLPLALKLQSPVVLPVAFGLGTSLPVVLFALVLGLASRAVGHWFKRVRQLETGLRLAAAFAFLGVGFYYSVLCLTQKL